MEIIRNLGKCPKSSKGFVQISKDVQFDVKSQREAADVQIRKAGHFKAFLKENNDMFCLVVTNQWTDEPWSWGRFGCMLSCLGWYIDMDWMCFSILTLYLLKGQQGHFTGSPPRRAATEFNHKSHWQKCKKGRLHSKWADFCFFVKCWRCVQVGVCKVMKSFFFWF